MRNDERAAAEQALATQSLTGLFIVQWDASSQSHNSFFFFSPLISAVRSYFSGMEGEGERKSKRWGGGESSVSVMRSPLVSAAMRVYCMCVLT